MTVRPGRDMGVGGALLREVVIGALAGVLLFFATSWIAARWLERGPIGSAGSLSLATLLMVAIATGIGARHPVGAMASGVLITLLVIVGLASGSPADAAIATGWDPWSTVRQGAHQPAVAAVAGALTALGATLLAPRLRRNKPDM